MKRIVLFLVTNIAVLLVLSIIMQVFGVGQFLTAEGIDPVSLLVFSAVIGFGGSIISLSRAIGEAAPLLLLVTEVVGEAQRNLPCIPAAERPLQKSFILPLDAESCDVERIFDPKTQARFPVEKLLPKRHIRAREGADPAVLDIHRCSVKVRKLKRKTRADVDHPAATSGPAEGVVADSGDGEPDVDALAVERAEPARRHAHDRQRLAVDDDRLVQDVGVRAQLRRPVGVPEHHNEFTTLPGVVGGPEHQQRAQKGDRNADRHPRREPALEKKGQRQQDQNQPAARVHNTGHQKTQ